MDNSKRRGWLWCGIVGVVVILAVVLLPFKKAYNGAEVEILEDSIVEEVKVQEPYSYTEKRARPQPTEPQQQPKIDYKKLYEQPEKRITKYDTFRIRINEADTNDWKELRGIGSGYAKRIVNYRESLGGYESKEQLKEVYGMSDALYELIAPHLVVDAENIVRMNLNTVPLDKLKKHPYLDYYQAKAIVKYREQVGKFSTIEEVLNIPIIDSTTFKKIKKYITI